jgi:DNA polymerase-3 subunit gamma/tau
MAYQSLYRRYRPQTFGEIRGQQHVVGALQNAVVKSEVGHAYLLHGPRGTGKTTSARVLAKALNCEHLGTDGEPCGECESCRAIEHGRSFDLHELDAASNNKVEDMRDLLGKVNLGNPGRAKVYILDEVHMLTSQAENALLKTLEEPPDHVTWVLATTEPHKVVETIRSRCQVFQLTLLGAEEMTEHVRWVIDDAQLDVSDAAVEYVVKVGGGSVRDTLSALDRVVAAGGVVEIDTSTDVMVDAIAGRDVAAALAAVGEAAARGRSEKPSWLVCAMRFSQRWVLRSHACRRHRLIERPRLRLRCRLQR